MFGILLLANHWKSMYTHTVVAYHRYPHEIIFDCKCGRRPHLLRFVAHQGLPTAGLGALV